MKINNESMQDNIQKLNNHKSIIWNSLWTSKYTNYISLFFLVKIVIYYIYFTNEMYFGNNASGIISPNTNHSVDTIDMYDEFIDIIRKPTPPRLPPSPVQRGMVQNLLTYFKLV